MSFTNYKINVSLYKFELFSAHLTPCKVKDQIIEHDQVCNGFFDCIDRLDESRCKKYSSNFNYKTFKICTVNGTNNYTNQAKNGS